MTVRRQCGVASGELLACVCGTDQVGLGLDIDPLQSSDWGAQGSTLHCLSRSCFLQSMKAACT